MSEERARRGLQEVRAHVLFAFVGMPTFPLAVALGLLVYWCDDPALALERIAAMVALASQQHGGKEQKYADLAGVRDAAEFAKLNRVFAWPTASVCDMPWTPTISPPSTT